MRKIDYIDSVNSLNMKRRTLAGNCGVGVFVIALVAVVIAFSTPSWLVSDYRITGAKLDRLGLWVHCFKSLPDVNDDYQRRFFVGCRWVYDPFTTGYDEIRGFLLPGTFASISRFLEVCSNLFIFSFNSLHDYHTIFLHTLYDWSSRGTCSCSSVLLVRWTRSKTFRSLNKGN